MIKRSETSFCFFKSTKLLTRIIRWNLISRIWKLINNVCLWIFKTRSDRSHISRKGLLYRFHYIPWDRHCFQGRSTPPKLGLVEEIAFERYSASFRSYSQALVQERGETYLRGLPLKFTTALSITYNISYYSFIRILFYILVSRFYMKNENGDWRNFTIKNFIVDTDHLI